MKAKVALIGVSGYGQVHFEQLRKLADQGILDLSAVVVINPDQVQKQLEILARYGSRIYASTEEMYRDLSGKLDLVCIPTGIAFHEPMTVEALRTAPACWWKSPPRDPWPTLKKCRRRNASPAVTSSRSDSSTSMRGNCSSSSVICSRAVWDASGPSQ